MLLEKKSHIDHTLLLNNSVSKLMGFAKGEINILDQEIKKTLLSTKDSDKMNLLIALPRYKSSTLSDNDVISMQKTNGKRTYKINGKSVEKEKVFFLQKYKDSKNITMLKLQQSKQNKILKTLHTYFEKNNIDSSLNVKDKDISYFSVTIKPKELKKFIQHYGSYIGAIGLNKAHTLSVGDAMLSTRVDPVVLHWSTQGNNKKGKGIGIYYADGFCPATEDVEGEYFEFTSTNALPNRWDHTFLVTGIIASVAPEAYKYCKNLSYTPSNELSFPNTLVNTTEIAQSRNQGAEIQIESYSLNQQTDDNTTYTFDDYVWDQHVNATDNLVFVSAGNHNRGKSTSVESPANTFNVITVGNYDDETSSIYVDEIYTADTWGFSNFTNPALGNEKPEIVAPGRAITYTFNNKTVTDTGTSFAAPHAAAIAADMFSENPYLQESAAVAKAMILASSVNEITDVTNQGDSATGAGGINIEQGIYHDIFATYSKNLSGKLNWLGQASCYRENFSAGNFRKRVRVALTWMIDEDYLLEHNNMGTILFFRVNDNDGNIVARSWIGSLEFRNSNDWRHDNWAVADFNPKNYNDNYTIDICRYNTYSNNKNDPIHMGLAITSEGF